MMEKIRNDPDRSLNATYISVNLPSEPDQASSLPLSVARSLNLTHPTMHLDRRHSHRNAPGRGARGGYSVLPAAPCCYA
jgi:hypothetical protein